jgi:hypothetical protein
VTAVAEPSTPQQAEPDKKPRRKRSRRRVVVLLLLVLILLLIAARVAMPSVLVWYVNRTLDQSLLYDGAIADVDVYLLRGGYSIEDVRIIKTTGSVPVPLFAARRVDLLIQWDTLLAGKVVGKIEMHQPELNFVDSESDSGDQTGAGGPWLEIIQDLFPFKINHAAIHDGSIHFRAFGTDPPVDVYLSQVEATITNLTNIHDDVAPLVSTVKANALAMDQAKLEYEMKLDPFSYRPTYTLALRLLGLDVTKVNALARAYGAFDFEYGFFDLVVELKSTEGRLEGYVKPLFRHLRILSLTQDVKEDNVLEVFWEALVGAVSEVLKNPPRDQFATRIPIRGDAEGAVNTDILAVVGNVLRNAFIRAYLPRLQGTGPAGDSGLEFGPGEMSDPVSVGD